MTHNKFNDSEKGEKTMQKPVFIDTDKLPASEAVVKLMLERSGHSMLEVLANLDKAQLVFDYTNGRLMCSKEKCFHKADRKAGYKDITDDLIDTVGSEDFVDRYTSKYMHEKGITLTEQECIKFAKSAKFWRDHSWLGSLDVSGKSFSLLRGMADPFRGELYIASEETKHIGDIYHIKLSKESRDWILKILYNKLQSQYDAIMNKEHLVKKGSLDVTDLALVLDPK